MKTATTTNTIQKTASQTGPLPAPGSLGQFAYRDGVWYLTPALKTHTKATS